MTVILIILLLLIVSMINTIHASGEEEVSGLSTGISLLCTITLVILAGIYCTEYNNLKAIYDGKCPELEKVEVYRIK